MRRTLLILLAAAAACWAQTPALTTITKPTYGASGTITIVSNETFVTPDGYLVPKGYEATVTVTQGGSLSVALPPNIGSQPPGTSYTAYYDVSPGGQYSETWIVPETTPVDLSEVRTLSPPVPTIMLPISQITPPPSCGSGLLGVDQAGTGWTCAQGSGTGTVTSVGLGAPSSLFTVSGSPVTTSGTLGLSLASQTANQVFAAPNGSAGVPAFRAIALADLPGSGAATVSTTAPLSGGGVLSLGGSLTLSCASCLTAIPDPTASTLGGAESYAAPAHEWLTALSTSGTWTASQPGFADLSGSPTAGQIAGAGALSNATTGNAATATALAATPTICSSGQAAQGILASGDATGCFTPSGGGSMVYPGAGVPDSTGSAWGTSYAVGTGDNDLLQVGSGGTIPAAVVPTLNQNTTGNAATATALATTPTQCPSTEIQTGIQANGDANCQDPLVSGPTANGSAPAAGSNPVLTGGWDGTDVRTFSTDATGRLNVNVSGTVPVSGTFWQTTQPVSLTALPALAAGSATIGAISNTSFAATQSSGANLHADIDNFPATQPVSGTVTANAGTGFPVVPTASAAVNDSASGLTQIVAAVSGKSIYVTGYTVVANAAVTVQWEYGAGTACGTGTTALTGPMSFAANGGAAPHQTLFVPSGDALCLNLGAAVQVGGSVSYAQQ